MNVWDSPQTQPSCLLWLLPPSSAFVSSSVPCFTEDSQKGERCRVPFLSSPPPAIRLLFFFSFTWFNIYCPSSLLLSFFFYLNFSLISSQTLGSIYFLLLLQCLTARSSCLLFNSTVPSCCPLRCFPNFWRLSGAAWFCPSLFFLHSHQERHWDSELCLLSTTTTRRLNSCWTTDGFPVKLTSNIKTYAVCWLLYYSFSLQWCWVLLLLTPGALSVDTLWPSPTGQAHLRISSLFKRLLI